MLHGSNEPLQEINSNNSTFKNPKKISTTVYERGSQYMFNFCLIVKKHDKSSPFVDICKKISKFLLQIEQEDYILSNPNTGLLEIKNITAKIFKSINHNGQISYLYTSKNGYDILLSSHIGPFHIKTYMPEIYEVPFIWPHVRYQCFHLINSGNYDLPTGQLLDREIEVIKNEIRALQENNSHNFYANFPTSPPGSISGRPTQVGPGGPGPGSATGATYVYDKNSVLANADAKLSTEYGIDNLTHISKLADQLHMRADLVCQIVADLHFYEFLTTVSIYQMTNRYRLSININQFVKNYDLQHHIISYSFNKKINFPHPPNIDLNHILNLLQEYNNDSDMYQIKKMVKYKKLLKIIDLKRFTMACEAYNLIKRVYDYPMIENVLTGDIKMDCILCHFAEFVKELEKEVYLGQKRSAHNSGSGPGANPKNSQKSQPQNLPSAQGQNRQEIPRKIRKYSELFLQSERENFKLLESNNLRKELIKLLERKYGKPVTFIYKWLLFLDFSRNCLVPNTKIQK